MSLIKSISGIRGTIGGKAGDGLTPVDIVKFTTGYGRWLLTTVSNGTKCKVVVGRDARISGQMVQSIVTSTLSALGIDVVCLQLSTTPTVELAVVWHNANGGIIITARHNPKQWNALKLLNSSGEFISAADGEMVLQFAEDGQTNYAEVTKLGKYEEDNVAIEKHIACILELPMVDVEAIRSKNFRIVVDAVNSVGGIAVPMRLKSLGVEDIIELYCVPTSTFPHNPEPLPENLVDLSQMVKRKDAHLGIVVDPDVDRLAFVCEDGEMFGEEYTLVAVADFVLKNKKGNRVSNLSSTRALRDVTEKAGLQYFASAVGEVNVVEMMKQQNAVIGGEGNGGIIT